jgi:hypothetical protein
MNRRSVTGRLRNAAVSDACMWLGPRRVGACAAKAGASWPRPSPLKFGRSRD